MPANDALGLVSDPQIALIKPSTDVAFEHHREIHPKTGGHRIIVTLPRPTRSSDASGLQRLAQDATFGWGVPDQVPAYMRNAESRTPSPSLEATDDPVDEAVRQALRLMRFDLVSSGVPHSSSASTGVPPGFGDTALTGPLQEAAVHVDALLAAVDRLRDWDQDRLRTLFVERAGCARPWQELLDKLRHVFGLELKGDFAVQTSLFIGYSLAFSVRRQDCFNDFLDSSILAAVNSILKLVAMADGAAAAASDSDDEDLAAAHLIISAVARIEKGRLLRLVQPRDSKDMFPPSLAVAWANASPDWVLVDGTYGNYQVLGVVESKPRAGTEDLERLTAHRLDPLGPEHYADRPQAAELSSPSPQPQPTSPTQGPVDAPSDTPQGDVGVRRSARIASLKSRTDVDGARPPHSVDEPDTPERKKQHRNIASQPNEPKAYGYVTRHDWQKSQLQLASQMLFWNVRQGLIWGDLTRALVPARMRKASAEETMAVDDGSSRFVLDFARHALHAPLAVAMPAGEDHSGDVATSTSSPPLASSSALVFHSSPNVVLGLVQWCLAAHRDHLANVPLLASLPTDLPFAHDPEATSFDDDETPSTPDSARRRRLKRPRGGHQGGGATEQPEASDAEPTTPDTSSRRSTNGSGSFGGPFGGPFGGSFGFSSPILGESGRSAPVRNPPTSPDEPPSAMARPKVSPPGPKDRPASPDKMTVERLPFARGAFANVYRALLIGPGQQDAKRFVYKVNKPTEADGPAPWAQRATQHRFESERALLQRLKHLQGGVLPRLWGTSKASEALVLPADASRALILEDAGRPINIQSAWPPSMPALERRRLVEQAYATLHSAGVCHGDVAPRNVLVSYDRAGECMSRPTATRPSSSRPATATDTTTSSAALTSPTNPASLATRVCIVDLAEAYPCRPGVPSEDEADHLRKMLDRHFGKPSAMA